MAKILLVDDDIDLVAQNKYELEQGGHLVSVGYSAKEGINQLEKEQPDLMIVDVMMEEPRAGFQLTREAAMKYPHLPVVVLSSDYERAEWCSENGETWNSVVKFLYKPIPTRELVRLIDALLADKAKGILVSSTC